MGYLNRNDELQRGYNPYIDAAKDDMGTLMDVGLLVMEPGDTYTIDEAEKEAAVLQQIPGVHELLSAYEKERPVLEKKYPDAAFALNISSNLFFHDRELTNIHMKAYSAILRGDPICEVHYRYDKEMNAYHARHNWD